ncbi:MAG: hypothetical protein KIT36_05880 [Alphaproteobacteria bacterium]|nr:hypothetical protein [Alphaproteobacteria bacterium]
MPDAGIGWVRPMTLTLWPHGLYWRGHLKWYERVCLVLWWISILIFGACLGAAIAVAYMTKFSRVGIEGGVALVLVGLAVGLVVRLLLAWAVRKSRRRRIRAY